MKVIIFIGGGLLPDLQGGSELLEIPKIMIGVGVDFLEGVGIIGSRFAPPLCLLLVIVRKGGSLV